MTTSGRATTFRMMKLLALVGLVLALEQRGVYAGSGSDTWGQDTLINLPNGRSRLTVPNQAGDTGQQDPVDLPCQCSDANPRDGITQAVGTTCFFQRVFGACNQEFMFDVNPELLPEGSCQMSCSRCSCCSAPADVIQSLGANKFIQALEASNPRLKDLFTNPGLAVTVLVPSDAAFDAALSQYGSLLQNPGVLQQILKFHIIPPEPTVKGLWTSPFFSQGAILHTMYDGSQTLTVPPFDMPSDTTWRGGLTGFKINGPYNSATVTKSDVMACKTYINIIDTVLLPFDPASPPPNNDQGVATLVGADSCTVTANSMIRGSDISTTSQKTIGECCSACASAGNCNAWTYCSQQGGCLMPSGSLIPFGQCVLKNSQELSNGSPAWFEDVNAVTVPLVSGYVNKGAAAAATVKSTSGGEFQG